MKLGKVEKQTFLYTLLKAYTRFIHNTFFYKKIIVIGLENIPKDKPVLVAPNHQNALMDALAIIFAQKIQPVFLARSDIFKNPIVAKILFAIKILPVYRIRDGKDKMVLNDIIFKKATEVLEHNRQVVIFPEAKHIDKKHVRHLKKGIQRIAFMLEENNDFKAGVQVVPAGIYYSSYWNFQSELVVTFGKPINVADYEDDYKNDPLNTLIKFSKILHDKITEQVIHIKDLKFHGEYDFLRNINKQQMLKELSLKPTTLNNLKADQETIKKADLIKNSDSEGFNRLMQNLKEYSEGLKKFKLKDWVLGDKDKNSNILLRVLVLILALPVFLYGFLNNIIAYSVPVFINKKITDRQFESSVSYGLGVLLFPIIYILQTLIVLFVFKIWYVALIYFISLPILGLIAFKIHRFFVKTMALLRFNKMNRKNKMTELLTLREEIINFLK